MNFKINSKTLLSALSKTQKAVSQNRIVPAAENYRLKGTNGTIEVFSCNTEISMQTSIAADFTGDFDLLIPAIKLLDFIKKLPDQPIEVSANDDALVTIKYGTKNTVTMQGEYNDNVFPEIQTTNGVNFTIPDLSSALSAVAYARGETTDPRAFIYSVWMEFTKKECRFIASNSHLIANICLPGKFAEEKHLLPYNLTNILLTNSGNADLNISKDSITVKIGDLIIKGRLIDSDWPQWRKILPEPVSKIDIDRATLMGAIDRVIGFANQATKLISLSVVNNELTVQSQNTDLNESSVETLPCIGADFSIRIKGHLLAGSLAKFSGQSIEINFTDEKTALIVTENGIDDYFALVMPSI